MQKRVGVREQAEDLTGMYRDAIPSSVAEFLAHSFAILASEDTDKNVWASPLAGKANIFSVPDGHRVDIHLDRLDPRLDPELVRGNLAGLLVQLWQGDSRPTKPLRGSLIWPSRRHL